MKIARSAFLAVALPAAALAGAAQAIADGFDEGRAKSRMQAAGYGDVADLHEGNLGEWMAQASKEGRHVMIVLHPDGSVALRQQTETPLPLPGASPAKP